MVYLTQTLKILMNHYVFNDMKTRRQQFRGCLRINLSCAGLTRFLTSEVFDPLELKIYALDGIESDFGHNCRF